MEQIEESCVQKRNEYTRLDIANEIERSANIPHFVLGTGGTHIGIIKQRCSGSLNYSCKSYYFSIVLLVLVAQITYLRGHRCLWQVK
jgi:hypothetical protein